MNARGGTVKRALGIGCTLLLAVGGIGGTAFGQEAGPMLSPQQLDALVAPVALYPDALLSQVLVACTYPQEVADAGQWLQANRYLQGQELIEAAQQQNWDPSIQALVAFPDVLGRLSSDMQWTADLGNAFLAQQADVMNAVQRMRAQAMAAGQLRSSPQQTVSTDMDDGQTTIEIQPTNPEMIYVPDYNPEYIWGPPAWGAYPALYYPGFAFGFHSGIYIGGFFGDLGWGGWGWGPNWHRHAVYENPSFFHRYGFRSEGRWGDRGEYGGGRVQWTHNGDHRMGASYSHPTAGYGSGGSYGGRASFGGAFSSHPINGGAYRTAPSYGGLRNAPSNGGNMYRPAPPAYGGMRSGPTYRPAPVPGANVYRQAPAYRAPAFNGNAYRPAPAPAYRSAPAFSPNVYRQAPPYRAPAFNGNAYRPAPAPAYRSAPAYNGNAYRSAPSFGGMRSAPPSRPAPSFGGGQRDGGGGGFRSSGGGFRGGRR